MQARTWTERFEPGQIKLIVVAIAATGLLVLVAVLSTSPWSNDQAASTNRARTELSQPAPNTRFLERNILPGDPRTYPVTSLGEYRFFEWNSLPGDAGANESALMSQKEFSFLDRNILPGDDTTLIPPAYERGNRH